MFSNVLKHIASLFLQAVKSSMYDFIQAIIQHCIQTGLHCNFARNTPLFGSKVMVTEFLRSNKTQYRLLKSSTMIKQSIIIITSEDGKIRERERQIGFLSHSYPQKLNLVIRWASTNNFTANVLAPLHLFWQRTKEQTKTYRYL